MKPYYFFLIFFCSMVSGGIRAQLTQAARYEKEAKYNDSEYLVVSMKKDGIALLREKEKNVGSDRLWEVILLDTLLQESWTTDLEVHSRLNIIGYDYNNGNLYYLFREGDANASELKLYKIDLIDKTAIEHEIKLEIDFKLTHFSVMANHALFGGYINKQPLVTIYNMVEKNNKIVPGFFLTNAEMLDLRVNVNNTFNVLLVERENKENKKLILKTFDDAGTLLLDDEVDIKSDRNILSAQTTALERDELMIIGTWSEKGSLRAANGIFTLPVDPFKQQEPHYYDFAEFNHFLDYLRPKRASIIRSNSLSSRTADKIPNFKAYVNLIRIAESDQGFYLLSEVYSSSSNQGNYRPNYYYPYGVSPFYGPSGFNAYNNRYGMPYPGAPPIYDSEARILHSSVIQFDGTGKFKQDFGLKLNELKLESLDQASDFQLTPSGAIVTFKKEKYVRQGLFDKTGELIRQDTISLKLNEPTETIRNESEENGGVRFWYNTTFYSWGYHTVTNISKRGEDRNRYVFYIHKYSEQ